MNTMPSAIHQQVAFVAIRAYAVHSYLYYVRHVNIISDDEFDLLCRWLIGNWVWIKPYDINNYLDITGLNAGTGYHLKVLGQTKQYADEMYEDHLKKKQPGSEFA